MAEKYTYRPLSTGDVIQEAPGKHRGTAGPAVLLFGTVFIVGFLLGSFVGSQTGLDEGVRTVLAVLTPECKAQWYIR